MKEITNNLNIMLYKANLFVPSALKCIRGRRLDKTKQKKKRTSQILKTPNNSLGVYQNKLGNNATRLTFLTYPLMVSTRILFSDRISLNFDFSDLLIASCDEGRTDLGMVFISSLHILGLQFELMISCCFLVYTR